MSYLSFSVCNTGPSKVKIMDTLEGDLQYLLTDFRLFARGSESIFESPFLFSCAIRVQPLWKQWTLFLLIRGHNRHNGRCTTLWHIRC